MLICIKEFGQHPGVSPVWARPERWSSCTFSAVPKNHSDTVIENGRHEEQLCIERLAPVLQAKGPQSKESTMDGKVCDQRTDVRTAEAQEPVRNRLWLFGDGGWAGSYYHGPRDGTRANSQLIRRTVTNGIFMVGSVVVHQRRWEAETRSKIVHCPPQH